MKILYAIQGTGNGHLSRAMDIVPCLQKRAEVDLLVSGIQGDLVLPFPVKYKCRGMSFIFGKRGGVDLWHTFVKCNIRKLGKEISELPVEQYDMVINDFEPVSSWACYMKNKPCIALSHQAAVLSPNSPMPAHTDMIGKLILKNYAPASTQYGFHFQSYSDKIFTPVIRSQIRNRELTDEGHYTVYLPSYDDSRLIEHLSTYTSTRWDVFSKHNKKPFQYKNVCIQPVDNEKFVDSMARASGVLCGAGFETPAEALFMKKKVLVIPMKNQYEQSLNAAALNDMGVPVIRSLKPKHLIETWLADGRAIDVQYKDTTQEIVDMIISTHGGDVAHDWNIYNQFEESLASR